MAETRMSKRMAARCVSLAGPSPTTTEEATFRRSERIVAQCVALAAGVNTEWRDWAGLTPLVLENVAGHLRDDDVAHFMRFRVVCKLWMSRNGTENLRELGARVIDHSFHPRRWILLTKPAPEATPTRRKLLNVTTRQIIEVDLPELDGHAVVPGPAAAPEGMLVLRDERTLVVSLLNPLTRHVVELPTLQSLQPAGKEPIHDDAFREMHEVTAAGFVDASTVVVYFSYINKMAVARPGDVRWTLVGGLDPEFPLRSTATFQGRFYCVDRTDLLVVDLEQRAHPQLVFAADMERQFRTVSLVDDDGRLMAVCSWEEEVRFPRRRSLVEVRIKLFHVDLEEETLLPIEDLGERAIFTGPRGAAVLLPKTDYYFSVRRGTMYFSFGRYQMYFGAFHVHSRSHTGYVGSVWGGRLAEYVASYVTTHTGMH